MHMVVDEKIFDKNTEERYQQIVDAALTREKQSGFHEIVLSKISKQVDSPWGLGYLEGAVWSDEHPRKGLVDLKKVWHTANRIVEDLEAALLIRTKDNKTTLRFLLSYDEETWKKEVKYWAYLSDLLPKEDA